MWEWAWWSLYKIDASKKGHLRKNFPYKRPLSVERPMQETIYRKLFAYVQVDVEVPQHLRRYFLNSPPIFKYFVVSMDNFGTLMKEYAKNENILVPSKRIFISSFHLNNGTLITPLLLFYLKPGQVFNKIHRLVQYILKNCFNTFVLSAVNARRQRDENLNSSFVPWLWNC